MLESYDVMGILVDRDTVSIANHLGFADKNLLGRQKLPFPGKTVLGTQNPKDTSTGARNDLERLAKAMIYVRDELEADPERYAAPLFWLAQLLGYIAIPAPERVPTIRDLYIALTRLSKEVGDVIRAHEQILDDNIIDTDESKMISVEIYEAIQLLAAYGMSIKHAAMAA